MPELPEVETIVRDLRGRLVRFPSSVQFTRRLRGRTITSVERRGKYIVMPMDQNGQRFIVHLGMTGHLRVWEPEEAPVKHTHFRALLDSGVELRYDDPRQFGRLLLGTQKELIAARAFPARLGPEPIHGDLTEAEFETLIHSRRRPVKADGQLLQHVCVAR